MTTSGNPTRTIVTTTGMNGDVYTKQTDNTYDPSKVNCTEFQNGKVTQVQVTFRRGPAGSSSVVHTTGLEYTSGSPYYTGDNGVTQGVAQSGCVLTKKRVGAGLQPSPEKPRRTPRTPTMRTGMS